MQAFDIAIVGGGMVGLALVAALGDSDKRIALINQDRLSHTLPTSPCTRVSAINLKNQQQLANLDIWQRLDETRLCAYTDMKVWEQDSFANIEFNAEQVRCSHLGTIVENQALINALAASVSEQPNVQVFAPAKITRFSLGESQHALVLEDGQMLSTNLLIGADGGQSKVRQQTNMPVTFKDYGQHAIVATIKTALVHGNVARQVFTPSGPLALLPLADPNLCSIVWSQHIDSSQQLMALSKDAFEQALYVTSDGVLGDVTLESERQTFPLIMQDARKWLHNNVVLCGDAAHTIHPLAGHGANLGLDDVWHLANCLLTDQDLRQYERARKTAAVKMIAAMEGFHQLYTGNNPIKKLIRCAGLVLVDKQSALKRPFLFEAMGCHKI